MPRLSKNVFDNNMSSWVFLKKLQLRRNFLKYISILSVLVISILYSTFIYGQTPEIENLYLQLNSSRGDTASISILIKLSEEIQNIDLKESHTIVQKALELSRRLGDEKKEAYALHQLGLVAWNLDDRSISLDYFEECDKLSKKLNLNVLRINNLMRIANFHRYFSDDSTKTVNYLLQSADLSNSINYHKGAGRSYAKLASFYTKYKQIELSEKYLNLSAQNYLKTEIGIRTIAHYYNEVADKIWGTDPEKSMDLLLKGREYFETPGIKASLAKAYSYSGDHNKALIYLKEAIPYYRETEKTRRMLGIAMGQLAEVHIALENFEAADKVSNEGIELLSQLGRSDQRAIPILYRVKGQVKEQMGNNEAALAFYKKSIAEAIRIKYNYEEVKAIGMLGHFYLNTNPEKAEQYCSKSLEKAKNKLYTDLEINACDCLYTAHKKEDAFVDALKYYEQKIMLSDSVSTLKVKHALDVNTKLALKNQQIADQVMQEEIKEKELLHQYSLNRALIVCSILFFILIAFLSFVYKRIRKQNDEINLKTKELEYANQSLGQSNEELARFAHVASHDLKSPLRNIISFTELLKNNLKDNENQIVKDSIKFIENGGNRMNQLIEDILEYSKISGQREVKLERVDTNKLIEEISILIPNVINGKMVNIDADQLPNLKWNSSKLFLLFKNLIENGLKYNESDAPTVKIYFENKNDQPAFFIKDNGIGISEKYHEQIFVMFQRLHTQDQYEGTGLGLPTCKKIVEELDGTIQLISKLGEGTTIKINLPEELVIQNEHNTQLTAPA